MESNHTYYKYNNLYWYPKIFKVLTVVSIYKNDNKNREITTTLRMLLAI